MVSVLNSHSNAASRSWHLWEIGLIFAPGLPSGWPKSSILHPNPSLPHQVYKSVTDDKDQPYPSLEVMPNILHLIVFFIPLESRVE